MRCAESWDSHDAGRLGRSLLRRASGVPRALLPRAHRPTRTPQEKPGSTSGCGGGQVLHRLFDRPPAVAPGAAQILGWMLAGTFLVLPASPRLWGVSEARTAPRTPLASPP